MYQSMPSYAAHTVLEHVNGVSLVQEPDGGTPVSRLIHGPAGENGFFGSGGSSTMLF